MKVKLICSDSDRDSIIRQLTDKGIEVSDEADYILYQNNNDKSYIPSQDENGSISLIEYNDILYFEAQDKITYCLSNKGRYIVKEKLYSLEEKMILENFFRVSKSYIVNLKYIEKIIPWIGSKYVLEMKNGEQIDVTRSYFKAFKNRLGI